MKKQIKVDLGDRSYNIVIGKNAITEISKLVYNFSKIIVITDDIVYNLHYQCIKNFLPQHQTIVIENGEKAKSFTVANNICEQILQHNIDRKSLIIAFGGGVVGDLAGFVAAILLRGIAFIQVPTTLLAMVDSSVGGKVAINSLYGKNLLGSFYQPKAVICDLDFLATLPNRQFLAGYAEVAKYGFIADNNFFSYLDSNYNDILQGDERHLLEIVAKSCQIKADIVARDEFELGDRALLNFGHTFAHVFETETNYSGEILHGEAVALGMAMAMQMSFKLNLIDKSQLDLALNHLNKLGFKLHASYFRQSWLVDNLVQHLFKDKKNQHKQLVFILLDKIGRAKIIKNVDLQLFIDVLKDFI
jgi:3-dehydroquinate synthase